MTGHQATTAAARASGRTIRWRGERFELLASPAVYRPALKTLIVADLHLGKAASFRSAGVPVPGGTTQRNLQRLAAALDSREARRLIVLGDLFHAPDGCDERLFNALRAWRTERTRLEIIIVRGNHDRRAGDPPRDLGFICVDEPFVDDGVVMCHDAQCDANGCDGASADEGVILNSAPTLAGHVHPCAVLHDVHGATLRAPCFVFGPEVALLPAFGGFTGMHPVRPRRDERIFAVGTDEIIEVKRINA